MNTENPNEVEIDIRTIFQILLRWWWVIALLAILLPSAAYFHSVNSYQPTYTATASMVVNSKQFRVIGENTVVTTNDIFISQKLVNTYTVILKSNRVMEYVAQDLKLDMSPVEMRSYVTVTSAKDSEVLFVAVRHPDSHLAVNIANSIMKVAPTAITETVEVGSVKVVDYAKLPKYPIPPQTFKQTAIGAVIGLMLGVLIAFFLGFMLGTVRNSNEISTKLLLTPLGEIPHAGGRKGRRRSFNPIIGSESTDFWFEEAFKSLRTQIQYLAGVNTLKKILVTSTAEREGKTTVSINLALSLVASGKSVLLMDCDLRRPSIHKKLGVTVDNDKSLISVLKGQCNIRESIFCDEERGLSIIPCGQTDKDSPELLGSLEMQKLLEVLENEYDFIIMDTPPANLVSDAVAMSSYVNGVILVVRQDHAKVDRIVETRDSLQNVGAHIMGSVLNDIRDISIGVGSRYKYHHYRYYNNDQNSGHEYEHGM